LLLIELCQARFILWSGFEWEVLNSNGAAVAPGPNIYGDDATTVWVDGITRNLHLNLHYDTKLNAWICAFLTLRKPLGNGGYRYRATSEVAAFSDPYVALGMGISASPTQFLETQLTRGGNSSNLAPNGRYCLRPSSSINASCMSWNQPTDVQNPVYVTEFLKSRVDFFSTYAGSVQPPFAFWQVENATLVPPVDNMFANVGLWLVNGMTTLAKNATVEVILRNFVHEVIP